MIGLLALAVAATPEEVLGALAASEDVGLRSRALAVLVETAPEPAGGAWGPRGRYDPNEYVQRAVIDALAARLPELESESALLAFVAAPSVEAWTRGRAAMAVAPAHPEAIAHAAASIPGDSRAGGLLVAATIAGDATARDRLGRLLREGTLPLEREALHRLRGLGLPLEPAMARAEPEVRLVLAAAALDATPEATRIFRRAIRDPELRAEAVEVLAGTTGRRADRLLRSSPDGRPARVARGDLPVSAGVRLLADPDEEVRRAAVAALGLRREPAAHAALRALLADPEEPLREAAAAALSGAPSPEDCAALAPLVEDAESYVRLAAASAQVRCRRARPS